MTLDKSEKLHDLPDVLFRAFSCRPFAEDFIAGRFRLGSLAHYLDTPDESRQDSSEGTAIYRDASGIKTTSDNGNIREQYILSCSTKDVDISYLRKKMGGYIVKIHDPSALAREMEYFLENNSVRTFNGVHGRLVEYTKNEVIHDEPDNFDLSSRQKNRGNAEENEYRLFFILSRQDFRFVQENHFYIKLGRPLKFAEILA
jgi:hypothetical protein